MSDPHLTQQDLVLLLDSDSDAARRHLDACPFCLARLQEIENTFSLFAARHQGSLNQQLPPAAPARAALRTRIEQAASRNHSSWWLPAYGFAACLLLFAIYNQPVDLSKPKMTLTPGEARNVSLNDVCRERANDSVRVVPASLQQQVFREYGINDTRPGAYEVDYLITPELGGANSIRNLWPEPYSSVWNAHVKDALEERLHGLVCSGQVDLATAQRDISTDWIGAYKKYFHTERPD